MDRVGGLWPPRGAGISLVVEEALDGVLLAIHGGQVEGGVLLSVNSQGVAPTTSHVSKTSH